MYYATLDSDGDRIEERATISRFKTMEEARDYLLAGYPGIDWDLNTAVIGYGQFSDCWKKMHSAPRVGDPALSPFSYTQVHILPPGNHPGGAHYWITPSPDVLVLVSIEERANT